MVNIKNAGAFGDGIHDDGKIINELLQKHRDIYIPQGEYIIKTTVKLPSGTHITAEKDAHVMIADNTQKGRYDFLVTNDDIASGNSDIQITGGIWDGNCSNNDRGTDLFDVTATTGAMFNFRNVKNLKLTNMVLKNPLCYYMRFCQAKNVTIENIRFASEHIIANQDGIHMAGFCNNFKIKNLYGEYGSPNDDFLAFNADDSLERQENFDFLNGPIENIQIENIHSEKCHCFVRLLSVDSPIENVTIRNISGDCKGAAICMDGARGCRVPLFDDADKPNGIGKIKDVLIANVSVSHSEDKTAPYITLQTNCENFKVKNFTGLDADGHFAFITKTCAHELKIGNDESNDGYPSEISNHDELWIKENTVNLFEFTRK